MEISGQTQVLLRKLDKNNDGVSYQEIKSLDSNGDKKLSKEEAAKIGIKNHKDIKEINEKILKHCDKHSPVELVFPLPEANLNPAKFSHAEKKFLGKFGIHPEKGKIKKYLMKKADESKLSTLSLETIKEHVKLINDIAKKHNINPLLIAGIIYEEQTHQLPPVDEDWALKKVESLSFGLKKFETWGLGQVGLGELKEQGINIKDRDKQIEYLRNPKNGIEVLAKKLKRLKGKLGYSLDKPLDLNNYHGAHGLAKMALLHNCHWDYPQRVLEYMKSPKIYQTITLPFKSDVNEKTNKNG